MRSTTLSFLLAVTLVAATSAAADDYTIDPNESRVVVHVGKSGVFGFAGHLHEVVGTPLRGRIVASRDPLSASSISVALRAKDLHVDAEKESGGDAPKVQGTMEREVLEIDAHPEISFTSERVGGREISSGHYALEVAGRLQLHGASQTVTVPVDVTLAEGTLTARGQIKVSHRAFGLKRASGGAGTVRVADELTIDLLVIAHLQTPAAGPRK